MKKTICLLIIFNWLISFNYSQTNISFPSNNSIWHSAGKNVFSNAIHSFIYKIQGDTIIDSIQYYKVYRLYDNTQIVNNISVYTAGLRITDSNRVYCKINGFPESILYDFNLQIGDTIHYLFGGALCGHEVAFMEMEHYRVVSSIDTIQLYNGEYRKRFQFNGSLADAWVEGIGSIYWCALFNPLISDITLCGDSYGFVCFKENDEIIYLDTTSFFSHYCGQWTDISENENDLNFDVNYNFYKKELQVNNNSYQNTFTTIILINALGQEISQTKFNSKEYCVRLNNLNIGIYIVKIIDEKGKIKTLKLMI